MDKVYLIYAMSNVSVFISKLGINSAVVPSRLMKLDETISYCRCPIVGVKSLL